MAGSSDVLETVREDDFVEYFIFPSVESNDDNEQESVLKRCLNKINRIVQKYTENYLWHRDEFKLIPRTSITNILISTQQACDELPPHLYGISHYGDNIEDEWFIVFLLQQVTKELSGLVVRVIDADGEFLLIEAANYLPLWANPETCEQKVYLYEGRLHIIKPDSKIGCIKDAVNKIIESPTESLASTDIQNSIINKLRDYPDKIKDNLHHAIIYLPIGVAAILKEKPNLIAPAVQAFCNRDSVDLKACRAMKYFPPENRVLTSVTFTKCLYAMLVHSNYLPDRRTGWNLPPVNDPNYKAHILGVKIACGFEILISQAKPSEDVEQDKAWHKYFKSLQDKNYFRGLLEHSRDYNNLLNKAKEYYINFRDSMHYTPAIGQEVLDLTKMLDYNIDEFKNIENNLPKGDDESWLNITPEELDKMLQERYGQRKIFSVNDNTNPTDFAAKVTQFLNHVSDVEGAEFPNGSPVRPPRGVKNKGKSKVSFSEGTKFVENQTTNKISFEPNSFSCAVQNILNFVIPEDDSWNLESDSDMSDYAEDKDIDMEACEEMKTKMQEYMEEMDKELSTTTIGMSFKKKNDESFDDIENFEPVDIDMNALKNILESYQLQMGEAGPSSNMLGPMGIHLDPENKFQGKNGDNK